MGEFTTEAFTGEFQDVGSFNHGYLQIRLGTLFNNTGQYTAVGDLSLDVSSTNLTGININLKDEVRPDIAVYPKRKMSRPQDIIRIAEMPLLVIEILSPKQGTYDILEKFKIYFKLGIRSCWLVEPVTAVVAVYSAIDQQQTFSRGDVIDPVLNVRLSISEIFD